MLYDMVFEGGGAKGMVFVGALRELDLRGHSPSRLMGTSAGSIMATFMAAGYTVSELADAMNEKQEGEPVFLGFLETPPVMGKEAIKSSAISKLLRAVNMKFIPDSMEEKLDEAIANAMASSSITSRIFSFIKRGGFFVAENFLTWMTEKLNTGIYPLDRGNFPKGQQRTFGDMSLSEFYDATGLELSLVAADTTNSQMLILNHRTAPDCPVVWAVRMSMSIPLLWYEVLWQPEWGSYRGKDISGNTIVDGGLLSNFPIELFISTQPQVTAVMGEKVTHDLNVLGFLIDESKEVPGVGDEKLKDGGSGVKFAEMKSIQRITNLLNTVTLAHDKSVIETFERFVVRLPAKGYGTIEFDMSDEKRDLLIAAGQQAAADYFDRLEAQSFSFGVDDITAEDLAPTANKIAEGILNR